MRITIIDKRHSQSIRQFGFMPLGWTNGFTRSARLVPINALRSAQYPGIRRHTRELTNSQINSALVGCRCDPRKRKEKGDTPRFCKDLRALCDDHIHRLRSVLLLTCQMQIAARHYILPLAQALIRYFLFQGLLELWESSCLPILQHVHRGEHCHWQE